MSDDTTQAPAVDATAPVEAAAPEVAAPAPKPDFVTLQVYADLVAHVEQFGAEGTARLYQILDEMRSLFNR